MHYIIGPDTPTPIELTQNSTFDELDLCAVGYQYVYFEEILQQRDYSPANIDLCSSLPRELPDLIEHIKGIDNATAGDTILINYASFFYELE